MKIFLKENYYVEIDEALFKEPNLTKHAVGSRAHILQDGEKFDPHDPKFDSSMTKEEYAEQARILSEMPVGTHADNNNPKNLKDNVFGWVIKNSQSDKGRNIKIKIPTEKTTYNPNMFPELVMYSQDDEVITYMLLQGVWKINRYNRDFAGELDENNSLNEDVIQEASDINLDYDYKTSDVDIDAKDVFDLHKSDSSYSTGLLPGSDEVDYYKEQKNKIGEIVYMTPEEYYEACSKGFNVPVEKLKQQRMRYPGHEHIDDLKKIITQKGKKLPIPYLDYTNGFGQEGLHRMMAVAELFGWTTDKFPVLVIKHADEDKYIEDLKWQDQRKLEYDIIMPSLKYHYSDVEELIEQLEWELERNDYGWEYIKHPNKLKIEFDNGVLTFTDPESDFKYVSNEHTEEIVFRDPDDEEELPELSDKDLDEIDDLLAAEVTDDDLFL